MSFVSAKTAVPLGGPGRGSSLGSETHPAFILFKTAVLLSSKVGQRRQEVDKRMRTGSGQAKLGISPEPQVSIFTLTHHRYSWFRECLQRNALKTTGFNPTLSKGLLLLLLVQYLLSTSMSFVSATSAFPLSSKVGQQRREVDKRMRTGGGPAKLGGDEKGRWPRETGGGGD